MTKICNIFVALSVCVPLIWRRFFNLFEKFTNLKSLKVSLKYVSFWILNNAFQCFWPWLLCGNVRERKRGISFGCALLKVLGAHDTNNAHCKFWIRWLTLSTLSRDISTFCPYLPAEELIQSIIKNLMDYWIIFNYWIILKVGPIDCKNGCLI